jgi:hypothetical protein
VGLYPATGRAEVKKDANFADQNVQTIKIDDFSFGIINGTHVGKTYSPSQPLGSASYAVRCYCREGLGLRAFPTYTNTTFGRTFQPAAGYANGFLTIAGMRVIGNYSNNLGPHDNVVISWSAQEQGLAGQVSNFLIDVSGNNFFQTGPVNTVFTTPWPSMARAFYNPNPATPVMGCVTVDPIPPFGDLVIVPNTSGAGNFSLVVQTLVIPKLAYVNGRTVLMGWTSSSSVGLGTPDAFYSSDVNNTTNITGPEFFFPEYGTSVGAWGSISTGEFFIVFQGGGGVLILSDIQDPSEAIILPGIPGTGAGIGPAVPTQNGLIYVTDYDGAWIWDGGNSAVKISSQVQDTALVRNTSWFPSQVADLVGSCTVHSDIWINWVFFANNYVYDTLTESWWQCEDPAVNSFEVFAGGSYSGEFFYSSIGTQTTTTTGLCAVPVVKWDHATPSPTYTWISNPISPTPGALASLQTVEVCASNQTATPCTITITPTVPPGQQPFPGNQNPTQSAVVTIPAFAVAYRGQVRFGYQDYNIMIRVDAANSTPPNSAPDIHEITCGITPISTTNVNA